MNESDDLDILGVTFDSKMTFEKYLLKDFVSCGSPGEYFKTDLFLGDAFGIW